MSSVVEYFEGHCTLLRAMQDQYKLSRINQRGISFKCARRLSMCTLSGYRVSRYSDIPTLYNYEVGNAYERDITVFRLSNAIHEAYKQDHILIAPSIEAEGKFTYNQKPKDMFNDKRRVRMTFARLVRRVLKLDSSVISDDSLERISRDVTQRFWPSGNLTVLRGRELLTAFRHEVGGHSCMTGKEEGYSPVRLYGENPKKVGVAVLHERHMCPDYDGHARALVWNTDQGKVFIDRVYARTGNYRDEMKAALKIKYPEAVFRQHNDYPQDTEVSSHMSVTMYNCDMSEDMFPWMDTFRYIESYEHDDWITLSSDEEDNNCGILECTEGKWVDKNENEFYCESCDNTYDEDDTYRYTTHSGLTICSGCRSDYYFECGDCNGIFHVDDSYAIGDGYHHVCSGCLEDNYTYCETCYDNRPNSEMTYLGGVQEEVCDCCIEEFVQCDYCGDWCKRDDYDDEHEHCIEKLKEKKLLEEAEARTGSPPAQLAPEPVPDACTLSRAESTDAPVLAPIDERVVAFMEACSDLARSQAVPVTTSHPSPRPITARVEYRDIEPGVKIVTRYEDDRIVGRFRHTLDHSGMLRIEHLPVPHEDRPVLVGESNE